MAFKKVTDSQTDGMYIIGSSDKNRYPIGFQYLVGGTIYTVREDVTKDAGSEMRRIVTSEGSTEIMTLESIDLDLKEVDATVLNDGKPKQKPVDEPNQEEKPAIDKRIAEASSKEKEDKKGEENEFDGIEW